MLNNYNVSHYGNILDQLNMASAAPKKKMFIIFKKKVHPPDSKNILSNVDVNLI